MFVTVALALVCILLLLQHKWKRRRIIACVNKCSGPPTVPFFGHVFHCFGGSQAIMKKCLYYVTQYESPIRTWLFHIPYVGVYTPEDIQLVTTKCLEKDHNFELLGELIGDGILTSKVERWKRGRRMVSAAFNPAVLSKPFLDVFNQQNQLLIEQLKTEANLGQYFDLWSYISKSSLNTIMKTALGHADDIDEKDFIKTITAFEKATKLICKRIYQPWLRPSFLFNIYLLLTGCWNVMKDSRKLPMEVLEKRRKQLKNERANNDSTNNEKPLKNMIDILLNANEADLYTNQEIVDEVTTIMFAGSETNAITISYTLLMLAIKEDIQEKVLAELQEIFGNSDRMPSIDDLGQMHYLEQCIKETLRRVSVAPLSARVPSEDITLSTGHVIPAGVTIVTGYAALHLDEKYYTNPYTWNPANFDPDKVANRPANAFVPFGYGPRQCVGYKYGMLAMKTQISSILRTFKLTTDMKETDIELDVDVLVRCSTPYRVKIEYKENESGL